MSYLVLDYLEESCAKYGDKIAFVDEKSSITFKETRHLAKAISNEIINRIGAQNNKAILIYLPKSIQVIVSMLGVEYSGNFYTPTNIDFPHAKVLGIVDALSPVLIITDMTSKEKVLALGVEEKNIICYDSIDFTQNSEKFQINIANTLESDIVYTYFTSGSTGIPKGVTISHKNVVDYIDWVCEKFPIDETTIFGNQSALYFDISTQDIYATLKESATMVIIPDAFFAFPVKAVEFIKEKKINFLYWVPSAYVNLANFKALDSILLDEIKAIMFGGEVMPVKHLNYLQDRLPNLKFIANVYGPTETTVNATYYIINRDYTEDESLPLGRSIENKRIILLDGKDREVTQSNKQGELCISGSGISSGYYKNLAKSAEVFIQNPLHNDFQDIIYRTGDLALYDEVGLLHFCGRKDDQIKHLGYRIELGEIEASVLSLKNIDNCVTFYDEIKRKITLVYISNSIVSDRELKLSLGKLLPKYMVPTKYYKVEEFPINNNGKIDRLKLKKEYI